MSAWTPLRSHHGRRNLASTGVAAAVSSVLGALATHPAWCTFATALSAAIARRND